MCKPDLYPPTEPYDCGLMDVGHGHRVYWEECGSPDGKPALVIYGGLGSGAVPGWRRYFDPDRYRLILFDPAWLRTQYAERRRYAFGPRGEHDVEICWPTSNGFES